MTSHVHAFDAREGGSFRISLTYDEQTRTGKTTAHTDTYHGRFMNLAVHNAGPAIPADLLPSVFEPLARGHDHGTRGSIGLGLFIARTIVLAHGGDIQVISLPDAGTTFTLALPKIGR